LKYITQPTPAMNSPKQKQVPQVSFAQFLDYFPETTLPVTLGEESAHQYSKINEPFHKLAIEQFIYPIEPENTDELTEFVPCFRIPDTHAFHAVVYWRASLMSYQFVLATFTPKGQLIDRRVLAGTLVQNNLMTQSVATIEEDWMIYIISGQSPAHEELYEAARSKAFELELLPDGRIIHPM